MPFDSTFEASRWTSRRQPRLSSQCLPPEDSASASCPTLLRHSRLLISNFPSGLPYQQVPDEHRPSRFRSCSVCCSSSGYWRPSEWRSKICRTSYFTSGSICSTPDLAIRSLQPTMSGHARCPRRSYQRTPRPCWNPLPHRLHPRHRALQQLTTSILFPWWRPRTRSCDPPSPTCLSHPRRRPLRPVQHLRPHQMPSPARSTWRISFRACTRTC